MSDKAEISDNDFIDRLVRLICRRSPHDALEMVSFVVATTIALQVGPNPDDVSAVLEAWCVRMRIHAHWKLRQMGEEVVSKETMQ